MNRLFFFVALLLIPASLWPFRASEKTRRNYFAQVTVHANGPGCAVDIDDQHAGKTGDRGALVILEVEPGDHYVHVRCPNEQETAYFISPGSGENTSIGGVKSESASDPQTSPALSVAEARTQLSSLVQQAVQLRARGRLDEAVESLRAALKLDPENSDLHRELGITFLLGKDWKRARVEMLEAIRHDPTDADAYNGLGYALEKMGDLDDAVKQYRKATQLDPGDPTYRTHYFDILSKLAQEKAKKK